MRRFTFAAVLSAAVALEGGEVQAQPTAVIAAQPGERLSMMKGARVASAHLERDRLAGAEIRLGLTAQQLQGTLEGAWTELRWHELPPATVGGRLERDRAAVEIDGVVGSRSVDLVAIRSARTLEIDGTFGIHPVDLTVSPERIVGRLGPCSYQLKQAGEQYEGSIRCGGAPERMTLHIPAELAGRSQGALASILVAFLSV